MTLFFFFNWRDILLGTKSAHLQAVFSLINRFNKVCIQVWRCVCRVETFGHSLSSAVRPGQDKDAFSLA